MKLPLFLYASKVIILTIQEGIIMDDLAAFLGFKKSEKKPEKRK